MSKMRVEIKYLQVFKYKVESRKLVCKRIAKSQNGVEVGERGITGSRFSRTDVRLEHATAHSAHAAHTAHRWATSRLLLRCFHDGDLGRTE